MKYHELSNAPKLTVRRTTAVAMLEHAGVLDRMERAGWISPILKSNQYDLFSVEQLKGYVRRMEREELPA
jgi:hypothetical protein